MKKIIIAGGSGLVGRHAAAHWRKAGHQVKILVRSEVKHDDELKWDGEQLSAEALAWLWQCDILLNLCGKSVNCRYNSANKKAIIDSRVKSTLGLAKALRQLGRKIPYWLNASTATIYASSQTLQNEQEGIIGEGFSVEVAQAWEDALSQVSDVCEKSVALRMSIVLAEDAEFMLINRRLVKLGLGGAQGSGKQLVSWIHIEDLCSAFDFILENKLSGAINLAAPQAERNAELMRLMRLKWQRKIGIPAPAWLIPIGCLLMRTESELVLKSRCIQPKRMLESGFVFKYKTLAEALAVIEL